MPNIKNIRKETSKLNQTPTVDINYVMTFGKYNGREISKVIAIDPGYIIWCWENIKWFICNDEVRWLVSEALDTLYHVEEYENLEDNSLNFAYHEILSSWD